MADLSVNSDTIATFSVADYVILSLMLCVSAAIGIYYALTGGKQRTSGEFLMADRKLPMFPVAMSLLASFMSGITYLGVPADVYFNGTMFVWFALSHLISCFIISRTFVPVFYRLGITSVYEVMSHELCARQAWTNDTKSVTELSITSSISGVSLVWDHNTETIIWNHHEKCIQISTNMPDIGLGTWFYLI